MPFTLEAMHFFLAALHLLSTVAGGGFASASPAAEVAKLSAMLCRSGVSLKLTQGVVEPTFRALSSSFSKQPFSGNAPPLNLVVTFVMHSGRPGTAPGFDESFA